MRVLIVEDHKELAATIAVGLRREGMAVDIAFDGEDGLRHAAGDSYDVILLDRDLPKIHGDDVCRALVARGSRSRVLMLTAAHTIEDRVDGLGLGADDYLPKPFAFAELVARIRALSRRSPVASLPILTRGDLRVDTVQRIASRGGRRLSSVRRSSPSSSCSSPPRARPSRAEQLAARGWDEYVDPRRECRQGHGQPSAPQARRSTPDRDRPAYRLPDRLVSIGGPLRAHLPARTIRLRLTLIYGCLFLCSGAALLAITYVLVRHQYTSAFFISSGRVAVISAQRPGRSGGRPEAAAATGRNLRARRAEGVRGRPEGRPRGGPEPVGRGPQPAARELRDRARDHGRALDLARLADGRPRPPAAPHDHQHRARDLREQPPPPPGARRPRRRAQAAGQHLRRAPGTARVVVRGPAAIRRQRVP